MAGPDPRRSSRARTGQSQSQLSSATSSASGRAERSTRSFNKTGSPQKSTPTASLSSEPPDESIAAVAADDLLHRTRRTRAKDEDNDQTSTVADEIEMANGEELQDDDEAVRCVCGQEEYPGPPSLDDLKHATKDGFNIDSVFPTEITDDLAGFYVQCDVCKVWQHGACVGLTNDETLPEYYYCDECRGDLHKIYTSSNGPRFSIYLPLNRSSRAGSLVKDGARSPKSRETKSARQSAAAASQASKRRSTMNSRDAAYDEEEQLRRAIEASKEDALPEQEEGAPRRAKRSRSDSEEKPEATKRQRTDSRSASPTAEKQLIGEESDDGVSTRNGSSKKSRNAATRNQRERAEKEERERQRAEAASKRKGRAERRRADDSDPSEEIPLAARALANRSAATTTAAAAAAVVTTTASAEATPATDVPPSSQPAPDTPPAESAATTTAAHAAAQAAAAASAKSKGGRPTHKKKGRNQYTKDRDGRDEESPARSQSRDVQDSHGPGGGGAKQSGNEGGKSHSKGKGAMGSKVTLTEMKRRVTAMFDFITKTQVELAGETPPATGPGAAAAGDGSRRGSKANATPSSSSLPLITLNGGGGGGSGSGSSGGGISPKKPPESKEGDDTTATENGEKPASPPRDFKELNCVEMMDFLTRDLVHWQGQFAT